MQFWLNIWANVFLIIDEVKANLQAKASASQFEPSNNNSLKSNSKSSNDIKAAKQYQKLCSDNALLKRAVVKFVKILNVSQ